MQPSAQFITTKPRFTREADFRQERQFGAKVSASFEFIAAQFRPLVKCIAYFVLPGALLGGIGIGLVFSKMLGMMPNASSVRGGRGPMPIAQPFGHSPFSGFSFLGMGLAALGFLAAFLLLSSTVYAFVRVRLNTAPEEEVQPRQVWAFMAPRLGRVVAAWLLLTVGVLFTMGLLGGTLALVGPGFVVLLFPLFLWLAICLMLYFPTLWMEDEGVFSALRRSFYLIRGKWWSSLGLYMIMSFITGIINYLFIIPLYGLMFGRMLLHWSALDSEILTVIAGSIYALGWVFTAVLPLVAMLFQYFSLVERRDGLGLRQLVNSLGQTAAPQVSSTTYQPDEEGEY